MLSPALEFLFSEEETTEHSTAGAFLGLSGWFSLPLPSTQDFDRSIKKKKIEYVLVAVKEKIYFTSCRGIHF